MLLPPTAGTRGPPGTTMSVTEATTGMKEEEAAEVTTLAAPAGGLPRLGPRPATEDRERHHSHSTLALRI